MQFKNLIFDVDGTLWDSAAAVTAAWNEVLEKHPGSRAQALTTQDIYSYMGHTMTDIADRMLPDLSPERRAQVMDECMDYENTYLSAHSGDFYPGVRDTFRALLSRGYRLYIVSNCQTGYIETMLRCGGISSAIPLDNAGSSASEASARDAENAAGRGSSENLGCGDTEPPMISDFECFGKNQLKKAANIRLLMERNGLRPEECLYIGDTEMDEQAAGEAGIAFLHAAYGFGEAVRPIAVLPALSELPSVLETLARG